MKTYFKQILIPTVSAVTGGAVVVVAMKISPELRATITDTRPITVNNSDPISEFFNTQKNLRQHFNSILNDDFFSLPDHFENSVTDVSKREDDNFVYYDIKIEGLNATSISTKIEDGYITVTGATEKKSGSDDKANEEGSFSQSIYKSTFNRTFPLPEQVDQNKMEMIPEENKIILKFPKAKT